MTFIRPEKNDPTRRGRGSLRLMLAVLAVGAAEHAQATTFRIEIDFMEMAGLSHRPSPDVVAAVQQMFACQGHNLIIDVSDSIPHYNVLRRDPDDCASFFDYDGSADSFGAIKAAFADHSSDNGWHYCIFGHQFEDENCVTVGSSGLGETPGWNFIVTLGGWDPDGVGTEFEQAATLAHELGHNLGLTHCGYEDCSGHGNYSPLLPSIMSYRYTLNGVRTNLLCKRLTVDQALFKEIDYSHGRLCTVNENALNEPFGTYMRAVDWNCDGSFDTGVAQDINGANNGWCGSTSTLSLVDDLNEWAQISDPSRIASEGEVEVISCITLEEWRQVQQETAARGVCPQPALTTESCLAGENVFVGPSTASPNGSCNRTWAFVQAAHDGSPPDSVFFLKPGTYNDTVYGTVVLDKPGTYFSNVGLATIE